MNGPRKMQVELSVEELAALTGALRNACIEIEDDAEFGKSIGIPRAQACDLLSHMVDVLEIWQ